jgi:hypothetical protein
MYTHEIENQVAVLIKAGIISAKNERKACKVLRDECWTDQIAEIWSIEDVMNRAEDSGNIINVATARKVLNSIVEDYDANIGITWDVIDFHTPITGVIEHE